MTRFIICVSAIILSLFLQNDLIAQNHSSHESACSTPYIPMPSEDIPAYVSAIESGAMRHATDSLIIPLVIHNLTWNHIGYIPDYEFVEIVEKINDRLANRGENSNPEGIDTRIRVRLANIDPKGNPANGITHLEHPQVLDFERRVPFNLLWDDESYLNAFVYDGDEGWAYYPWTTSSSTYMMIGYERARLEEGIVTWVHEIGHIFGLLHTHENCASVRCLELGDMVCDTRPDQVSFQPCFDMDSCEFDSDPDDPENYLEGLNTLDMIDNYMDGGLCRSRFTEGQVERMHWVQQMYKPDWGSEENLFRSCPPISADFNISADYVEVNQTIQLEASEKGAYQYRWYIENQIISEEKVLETNFAEPGVYRIQLDMSLLKGECAGIFWSREKSISVRCVEDESLRIEIPDRMVLDSCYKINLSGVTNLSWSNENIEGISEEINICPSEFGLQELQISYGSGECQSKEMLHYMVHASSVRERSYFQQSMRFAADSASSQDFAKLYEIGEEAYRILGTENHARQQFDNAERHQNFIRTWFPFEQVGYEWELYHDSIPVLVETDHITQLQLNYLDMVEDTLDGSKYYLAFEHYTNRNNSDFILGKLNVLGKPIWTRRILMPDYHFYEGKLNGNKHINIMGNDLLVNMNQILFKVNKQGQVISSMGLNRSPTSLYDRPMNSSQLGISINENKIYYSQMIYVVDTSLYPTHTDGINNIYETAIWTGTLNQDLDLESSDFLKFDDQGLRVRPNTFISRPYKEGSLSFWYQSQSGKSQIHLLYVNAMNKVMDYKIIDILDNRLAFDVISAFHVLNSDEILIALSFGNNLTLYRIDRNLENAYLSNQEIILENVQLSNTIEDHWSTLREPQLSSVLTQDGILSNFYTENTTIDKNNFFLLPLDSNLQRCDSYNAFVGLKDSTLAKHNLQPGVESVPARIELEDIYLKRQVRTFVSETICESKHTPEDYRLAILDTICNPSGTLKIKIEICREDRLPEGTISLDFYFESPLEYEGDPFLEEDLLFLEGQSCVQKTYFMQGVGFYMFLNGDAGGERPYTLSKSFFDANEGIEYDYTNNMTFVDVCENSVSTWQEPIQLISLKLYPNPATQVLNINVEDESITDLEIYSSLGVLMHKASIDASKYKLDIKRWTDGLYIVKATIADGRSAITKFTKLDGF